MGIFLSKNQNLPPQLPPPSSSELHHRQDSILGKPYKNLTDDYKIGKELGRGKFAVTSICKEKSTGKKYACKSIPKRRLVTESEKQHLKREVRIMEHLSGQKNVVELKCTYEDNRSVHLIMEYCEGGELYDKMKAKGRYSEKIAAQIISSIMKVVYSLHFMGVMHRDLKPENFLLSKRGVLGFLPCYADYTMLKAIDFGLSAYIEEGKLNQEKVGTAFYVAPEVLRRQGYGKEVDIWSAGVILYMLLTGVPPFYGEDEKEIFRAVMKADPDMENHPWPSISKNAKKLVKKMLTVDPKKRPTAADVLNDQWLVDNGVATKNPIDDEFLVRMKNFRAMNKFQRFALQVIADIIPPDEQEGLKAMFHNIDTDEDKVITREELEKSLVRVGSNLGSEEIKIIAEAADADRNGLIDYNEFITAMMNFRRTYKEEHLLKAFQKFDKDDNNRISKDELKSMLEEYKMGDADTINDIISEIHVNADGEISYEDFCKMVKS
ncbi:unnamed protein product [Lactuca virosa]|uniref:non-specific serine/threonine protein kinase n=1 Tax=Lactuca virosa TaxID=75947 RepID=A0AAU9MWR9_9ASTR|nr:unnamed protein product [Lactuca virosa]CAH1447614.1 unnamed protein product [Lactuca virosa]CAH1454623.1 unnamed protein product [Lactuca virosa]